MTLAIIIDRGTLTTKHIVSYCQIRARYSTSNAVFAIHYMVIGGDGVHQFKTGHTVQKIDLRMDVRKMINKKEPVTIKI